MIMDLSQSAMWEYVPFYKAGINLLIFKQNNQWEICLPDEEDPDGYPRRIGMINDQGCGGDTLNSTRLGWRIDLQYRNKGIMKAVVREYLKEYKNFLPDGFEVEILKLNKSSINLARSLGFKWYGENSHSLFMVYNPSVKKADSLA